MKDFFISYNKADRLWATWIAWYLEDATYTTVLQEWDFRPGCNFVLEMQKASIECKRTIAVLSSEYLRAQFTQPEWAAAFAIDPQGWGRKLVPIKVQPCSTDGLLAQISYIDLVGLDENQARDRLLTGVHPERAKPLTPPVYPMRAAPTTPAPTFPAVLQNYEPFEAAPNLKADEGNSSDSIIRNGSTTHRVTTTVLVHLLFICLISYLLYKTNFLTDTVGYVKFPRDGTDRGEPVISEGTFEALLNSVILVTLGLYAAYIVRDIAARFVGRK